MSIPYNFNPLAVVANDFFTLIIKPGILNGNMVYSFAPYWNGERERECVLRRLG